MKPNKNQDRISKYLSMLNKGMLFDELSNTYLEKIGVLDILGGIPVPIAIDADGNMTTLSIAQAMARVIGGDKNYPYVDKYMAFIDKLTHGRTLEFLLKEGSAAADDERYEEACMYFRTAIMYDPKSRDALYLYARACQGAYEREDLTEDYVGNFKAESLEAFELLTVMHPEFAMGYYFLGYSYLNLGLYTKARLTWETFVDLIKQDEAESTADLADGQDEPMEVIRERRELLTEIGERLDTLNDPVIIEQACNQIMSGDFAGGLESLQKYKEGRYEQWWPLWYYMGVADESLGNVEAAIADYKKALTLTPSNIEIMQELLKLYEAINDMENIDKYRKKIEIVKSNIEDEKNQEE